MRLKSAVAPRVFRGELRAETGPSKLQQYRDNQKTVSNGPRPVPHRTGFAMCRVCPYGRNLAAGGRHRHNTRPSWSGITSCLDTSSAAPSSSSSVLRRCRKRHLHPVIQHEQVFDPFALGGKPFVRGKSRSTAWSRPAWARRRVGGMRSGSGRCCRRDRWNSDSRS